MKRKNTRPNNGVFLEMASITEHRPENGLEKELEKLKRKLKLGYELKVRWIPDGGGNLSGEVKHETIYVYDEDEKEALETLRHEFLDYAVCKVIEPYKEVSNRLITLINEEAYRKKEGLVKNLCKLIRE